MKLKLAYIVFFLFFNNLIGIANCNINEIVGSKNPIKFNVIFNKSNLNPLGLKFLTDQKEEISICEVNYYYYPKIEVRIYFKDNLKGYFGTNQSFPIAVEPSKERGVLKHNSVDIMYDNNFTYRFISYIQDSVSVLGKEYIKQIKKCDLRIGLPNIIIDEDIQEGDIITSYYEFTLDKDEIDFLLNYNLEILKETNHDVVKKAYDTLNFEASKKHYDK